MSTTGKQVFNKGVEMFKKGERAELKQKALEKKKDGRGVYNQKGERFPRKEQEHQRELYGAKESKGFEVTHSRNGKEGIKIL